MKNNNDPFHNTTLTDRLADILSIVLLVLFIIIAVLILISVLTIVSVEAATAIWGEYKVIYWLADLF